MAQPSEDETVMITDMEAGLEHLSRSTTKGSDVMLVVAEPYFKSLETAARVKEMAEELGIPRIYLVANKVRTPTERDAIEAFSKRHNLDVIATIPYDENVAAASLIPASPLDAHPDTEGVSALQELMATLDSMTAA